jgi:hypothetical protein
MREKVTLKTHQIANEKCPRFFYFLLILSTLTCCGQSTDKQTSLPVTNVVSVETSRRTINEKGMTLQTRFIPPQGFEREPSNEKSFAAYLRNLPLKPAGTKVKYYNGNIKDDDDV